MATRFDDGFLEDYERKRIRDEATIKARRGKTLTPRKELLKAGVKGQPVKTTEHIQQKRVIDWALKNERAIPELKLIHSIPMGGYNLSKIMQRNSKRKAESPGSLICFYQSPGAAFSGFISR